MSLQYLPPGVGGGGGVDFVETVILMGVCGSVQDLTPGVIAVVKSSAPHLLLFHCGFGVPDSFARIVLDSGAESWLV